MELAGENAELYQVRYKVQTEDGWSDWAYDGAELNVDKPVLAFAAELVEKPTAEETPAEAEVATQTPAASDVTNAAATSTVKAAGTPQTSDPINLTAFTVLAVAGVLALVGGAVLGVRASKRQ
jgi:cell division septation protein DedD